LNAPFPCPHSNYFVPFNQFPQTRHDQSNTAVIPSSIRLSIHSFRVIHSFIHSFIRSFIVIHDHQDLHSHAHKMARTAAAIQSVQSSLGLAREASDDTRIDPKQTPRRSSDVHGGDPHPKRGSQSGPPAPARSLACLLACLPLALRHPSRGKRTLRRRSRSLQTATGRAPRRPPPPSWARVGTS